METSDPALVKMLKSVTHYEAIELSPFVFSQVGQDHEAWHNRTWGSIVIMTQFLRC